MINEYETSEPAKIAWTRFSEDFGQILEEHKKFKTFRDNNFGVIATVEEGKGCTEATTEAANHYFTSYSQDFRCGYLNAHKTLGLNPACYCAMERDTKVT